MDLIPSSLTSQYFDVSVDEQSNCSISFTEKRISGISMVNSTEFREFHEGDEHDCQGKGGRVFILLFF